MNTPDEIPSNKGPDQNADSGLNSAAGARVPSPFDDDYVVPADPYWTEEREAASFERTLAAGVDEYVESGPDQQQWDETDAQHKARLEYGAWCLTQEGGGPADGEVMTPFSLGVEQMFQKLERAVGFSENINISSAYQLLAVEDGRVNAEEIARKNIDNKNKFPFDPAMTLEMAERAYVTDLAWRMKMPERAINKLVHVAQTAVAHLPECMHSFKMGRFSMAHMNNIAGHAWSLPVSALPEFDRLMAGIAEISTVAKLDVKARRIRERMHPDSIAERSVKAIANRSLTIDAARDGMAFLSAYLPAEQAQAIFNRSTLGATKLQCEEEERTMTQLRVDVFADLLISGETEGMRGIRAEVLVVVPVQTLIGTSEEPGMLENYGPISADAARALAGDAPFWRRLLTDPITNTIIDLERTRYTAPKELRLIARFRDETCTGAGCMKPAKDCELDHTEEWQFGGKTSLQNLSYLCKTHHMLKTVAGFKKSQDAEGNITWTTPTGFTATVAVTNPIGPLRKEAPPVDEDGFPF